MEFALIAVIISPALIFATAVELKDEQKADHLTPEQQRHWLELGRNGA